MDAFMSAIFGAKDIKASARVKSGSETRTVKLHKLPADTSEKAFAEAARLGVDLSIQVKSDDERARSLNGKGVYGAAATNAMCSVLGYVLPEEPKEEPKEEQAKPVNRIPAPSRNQAKTKDGAVAPAKE